nr:hypothetical protein [Chitinophagaceae bacterium]
MKTYLLSACLLFIFILTKAQTDSFEVNQTKFMKTYNFITMANKVETSILKLKVIPLCLNGWSNKIDISYENVPIIISYEHKLFPFLSYQIESKNIFFAQRDYYGNSILNINKHYEKEEADSIGIYYGEWGTSVHKKMIFNSSIAAELRYYYNARRKMHRKHGQNNFSGNYLALRGSKNVVQTGYDYHDMVFKHDNPFPDHNTHPFYDNNISLYYGAQRRFLKYFYIDMHAGIAYRYGSEKSKPQWYQP